MARTLSSLDAALCADYVRPQRLKRRFNRGEFSPFERIASDCFKPWTVEIVNHGVVSTITSA